MAKVSVCLGKAGKTTGTSDQDVLSKQPVKKTLTAFMTFILVCCASASQQDSSCLSQVLPNYSVLKRISLQFVVRPRDEGASEHFFESLITPIYQWILEKGDASVPFPMSEFVLGTKLKTDGSHKSRTLTTQAYWGVGAYFPEKWAMRYDVQKPNEFHEIRTDVALRYAQNAFYITISTSIRAPVSLAADAMIPDAILPKFAVHISRDTELWRVESGSVAFGNEPLREGEADGWRTLSEALADPYRFMPIVYACRTGLSDVELSSLKDRLQGYAILMYGAEPPPAYPLWRSIHENALPKEETLTVYYTVASGGTFFPKIVFENLSQILNGEDDGYQLCRVFRLLTASRRNRTPQKSGLYITELEDVH